MRAHTLYLGTHPTHTYTLSDCLAHAQGSRPVGLALVGVGADLETGLALRNGVGDGAQGSRRGPSLLLPEPISVWVSNHPLPQNSTPKLFWSWGSC